MNRYFSKPTVALHRVLTYAFFIQTGVAVVTITTAIASDNLTEATTLYKAGQFEKAAQTLQIELRAHPNDAAAHYLMGNILLRSQSRSEAAKEYQSAAALDPKGASGIYSRQELTQMAIEARGLNSTGMTAGANANFAPMQTSGRASSATPSGNPDYLGEDPDRAALRRSVNKTSQETEEVKSGLNLERQRRLQDLKNQCDDRVAVLNQQMHDDVAGNRGTRGHRGGYYDPEVFNAPIREDYAQKIKFVKDDTQKQIDEIKAYYQSRSDATEQAALNVDRQYLNPSSGAKIKLTPLGSDLHVHNYESNDEASGESVPLVAEPGKLNAAKTKPAAKTQTVTPRK